MGVWFISFYKQDFEAPLNVNKALDGSTYPGWKMSHKLGAQIFFFELQNAAGFHLGPVAPSTADTAPLHRLKNSRIRTHDPKFYILNHINNGYFNSHPNDILIILKNIYINTDL